MIGSYETIETDLLILGGGDAGPLAAFCAHANAPDLDITIAVKTPHNRGNYPRLLSHDSIQRHFEDTIRVGEFLNDHELVWLMVNRSREISEKLENGIDSPDQSRILAEHRALDLLTDRNGSVCGAVLLDMRTGRFVEVNARATLLATDGDPNVLSSDGIAIAHRVGADLIDMEMMQFQRSEAPFIIGGVRIDPQTRSTLDGLFVAGGDAGGVHGANMMEGNGATEAAVFGCVAGELIPHLLPPLRSVSDEQLEGIADDAMAPLLRSDGISIADVTTEMDHIMRNKVGLVRNGPDLLKAIDELESLSQLLGRVSVQPSRRFNSEWQDYLNLRSLLTVSCLTARSALAREESRGAHRRSDFPAADNAKFLKNVCVGSGGRIDLRPVNLTRMS